MIRRLRLCVAFFAFAPAIAPAYAQISFSTAVGLALKNSPKVLTAQADVDKALAALQQIRDAFIPNIVGGSGVGPPSYGYPLGQPSIFNITSQSLVFSYSQHDYLRAAPRLSSLRSGRARCDSPQPQRHSCTCSRGHCHHLPRARS